MAWKNVPESRYLDMLNILPPAAHDVSLGFLVGEAWMDVTCPVTNVERVGFLAFVELYSGNEKQFYESDRPVTRPEFKALTPAKVLTDLVPA